MLLSPLSHVIILSVPTNKTNDFNYPVMTYHLPSGIRSASAAAPQPPATALPPKTLPAGIITYTHFYAHHISSAVIGHTQIHFACQQKYLSY